MNAGFFLIIILIFLLMWLLLIRPQRRRQQEQQRMIESVAVGDEIVTAGGFYATVRAIRDEDVTVEIAPGTNVRLAKRAIAAVLPRENELEEAGDEEAEEPEEVGAAGSRDQRGS